jgi:hypothetical protein
MTLRKIWTTQYQRYGRAAYAESNNIYIDVIVAQIIALMASPDARFYKVEVDETGAYVGFFILDKGIVMMSKSRPQSIIFIDQFYNLIAETQTTEGYKSTVGSINLRNGLNA